MALKHLLKLVNLIASEAEAALVGTVPSLDVYCSVMRALVGVTLAARPS